MDKNEIQRQNPTGREDKNRNSSAGKKKSGSPMGLFSWTKLNFTLWALIAIAVIIIIFRFCSSTKNDSLPTVSVDDKIDVTPAIITSMKEIGEWEFLLVTDEELVDTTRKGFLRDDKLVRIYYGKLSLGINMHKAEPHWARMQGDSVIITLPGIELLDKDFIDETRTRAFIETGSWTDADRELMYHRAYRMMIRRCMTAANIKSARDNATEQFSKMMRALGVEKYEIRWEKDQ